jgi:thiamine pyrophosphate-dependent acetolactate synthase large subunit-like protein
MGELSQPAVRGAAEVVGFLADAGLGHFFGLPGSSMVSLLNELQRVQVEFVPAVHESVAVAMADGYARVAGRGCASVYMLPGLANSLGNLYNAWRDESPLVLLASQQMSRARFGQATVGEAELAELVRPYTRWAAEVPAGAPVRSRLAAAFRAAAGPPPGPAFLALPEDVLEEHGPAQDERSSTRVAAGPPDVSAVARAVAAAQRPLLIVGGQLQRFGGAGTLAALAERYEIPVALEAGWNDRLAIAPAHPNAVGRLVDPLASDISGQADVVIAAGCRNVLEAHPRAEPWFGAASFVAHVNADYAKLEFPHTADWSAACDPAAFIAALDSMLAQGPADPVLLAGRRARLEELRARKARPPETPYRPGGLALHDALDRGWVVDEAVSGSGPLLRTLSSLDGTRYISTTGASLGWATGASCGVALASGEPVTCVLGDGALFFGVQGLWTAVNRNLPVTYVVFDNGGYGSTRFFERQYAARLGDVAPAPGYVGSDLRGGGPPVGDVLRGFGVPTRTLAPGEDPRPAVVEAWEASAKGPNAIVIPIDF